MKKILLFTDLSYQAMLLRGVVANTASNIIVNKLEYILKDRLYTFLQPEIYGLPGYKLYPADIDKVVVFGGGVHINEIKQFVHHTKPDVEVIFTSDYSEAEYILNIKVPHTRSLATYNGLESIYSKLKHMLIDKLIVCSLPINNTITDFFEIVMNNMVKKGMEGLLGKNRDMEFYIYLSEAIGVANYIFNRYNVVGFDDLHIRNLNYLTHENSVIRYGVRDLTPHISEIPNIAIPGLLLIDENYLYVSLGDKKISKLAEKFEKTLGNKHTTISIIVDGDVKNIAMIKHDIILSESSIKEMLNETL